MEETSFTVLLFLSLVWKVLWQVVKVTSPIWIIFFLLFLYKLYKQYRLYGAKSFKIFRKKVKITHHDDLFSFMLSKLEGPKRLLKLPGYSFSLLMIHPQGIFLFYDILYQGTITGKKEDKTFLEQTSLKDIHPVPNFFHDVAEDIEKLRQLGIVGPLFPKLIISNICNYKVEKNPLGDVVRMKDFFIDISKEVKCKKIIYDKNQIRELYEVLRKGDN